MRKQSTKTPEPPERERADRAKQGHGPDETKRQPSTELQIMRDPPHQQREPCHANGITRDALHGDSRRFVAQYLRGRDPTQCLQRREGKSHEYPEPRKQPLQRRHDAGGRQIGAEERPECVHHGRVRSPSEGGPDQTRSQAHKQELDHQDGGDGVLGRAQATHHCDAAAMALPEATRRQRHRHGRNQHGKHRHQRKKLLRSIERPADFRATALDRDQFLPRLERCPKPVAQRLDLLHGACGQHRIADPASGRHQPGGREILGADHHARRKVDELCAAIRLECNHTCNAKPRLANLELIADVQSGHGEDLRIDPYLADLRPAWRELVRL